MKTTKNLSLQTAKTLIGKTIKVNYQGYKGQDGEIIFKLGNVVSELDYYRNLKEDVFQESNSEFKNRAEYWESYMTKEQLEAKKDKYLLIDSEGASTFIYTDKWNDYDFVCGDDYRFVTFEVVDEN